MIKLTIEDLQETAEFKVIEKPLIQSPIIAESDVVTIDNNLSTYVTGTQKRELVVNLGYLSRDGYELLRGFRDRQYENLKYPKATITSDVEIAPGGTPIEVEYRKDFDLETNDHELGIKSVELVKIGDNEDYIYKGNDGKYYVHKAIGKIASYNGETISTSYISTTGGLTTGATVYYVLATPIEYEITQGTLVAFRYAKTYAGQTNVWSETNGFDMPVKLDYIYEKTDLPARITGSTYEHLTNTKEASMNIYKLGGDTYQQTWTGKNLYKVQRLTHRGVTLTVNADGSINLRGTNDGTGGSYLIGNVPISFMENGASYTCWCNSTSLPSGLEIRLGANRNDTWVRNLMSPLSGSTVSRTFTANTTNADTIRCEVYVATGTTINVSNLKIQLEKGSSPTSFEPYVGGIPAPNPSYPQAVQTVTGLQRVNVVGKNLFNPIDQDYFVNNAATQAGKGGGYDTGAAIELEPNTTYVVTSKTTQARFRVILMDTLPTTFTGIWGFSGINRDGTSFTSLSFNSASHKYMIINATTLADVQVEKASTATDFEPYQSQEYEVNLGKNLFDKGHINNLHAWFLYDSTTFQTYTAADVSAYIPAEPNTTYTASKTKGNRFSFGSSELEPAGGVAITKAITNHNASSLTITTGPNDHYLAVFVRSIDSQDSYEDVLATLQIEKGSQATSYAAYFEPIELCKIGTYQDYIYKSGGNWWLHKEIDRLTINSTTLNSYNNHSGRYVTVNYTNSSAKIVSNDEIATRSNNFTGASMAQTWSGSINYAVSQASNNAYLQFCLPISTGASLEDIRTYFASLSTIVYYILATPTDTEIVSQELIENLENLWTTNGFDGHTTITMGAYDDDNAAPILEASQGEVTGKGTEFELEGTTRSPLTINKLIGNATQDGTPSTSTPIPIKTVQGSNNATFAGPGGDIEYDMVGKMVLSDQRIIDNCGTAEQVQVSFRESKQI